jgi:hypothetical protein
MIAGSPAPHAAAASATAAAAIITSSKAAAKDLSIAFLTTAR